MMQLGLKSRDLIKSAHLRALFTSPAKHSTPHKHKENYRYVDASKAPKDFDPQSAIVYSNFVTEEEGLSLKGDIMKRMKRKRFEKGHWDAVITDYKEVEMDVTHAHTHTNQYNSSTRTGTDTGTSADSGMNSYVNSGMSMSSLSLEAIQRVRDHIADSHPLCHTTGTKHVHSYWQKNISHTDEGVSKRSVKWMDTVHAIYLKKEGSLTAHVDSVKFSGGIVAGLSLLSPSIMRLRPAAPSELELEGSSDYDDHDHEHEHEHEHDHEHGEKGKSGGKALMNEGHVDLYLPPLSLYILSGVSRYRYTHELLACGSTFVFNEGNKRGRGHEDAATQATLINTQMGEDGDGDGDRSEQSGSILIERGDRISVIFRDAV